MKRAICHAVLCVVALALSAATCQRTHKTLSQSTEPDLSNRPGDTHVYFSPKISLDELRDVYRYKEGYCIELSQDQSMLDDAVSAIGPGWSSDTVTQEQLDAILEHIPESLGEKYIVYFPRTFCCEKKTLCGVSINGGEFGPTFFGALDSGSRTTAASPFDYPAWVGLGFKSGAPSWARKMHSENVSEELQAKTRSVLASSLGGEDWKPIQYYEIFLEYPSIKAVLCMVEMGQFKLLYCLEERKDGQLEMVPYDLKEGYTKNEGFVFEDHAEYDRGLWDSELMILPDMNGDGANELLIFSTITFLLDIQRFNGPLGNMARPRDWVVREVRALYWGP